MDYEFFNHFYPRVVDVVDRDLDFWKRIHYEINRRKTQLHFLTLVVEGAGQFEINGKKTSLKAGDIMHSYPGNRLKITSFKECPLRMYSIHYDYVMLRWEGAEVHAVEPKGGLPFPHRMEDHIHLREAFDHLFRLWNQKGAGYEWKAKLAFLKILEDICHIQKTQPEHDPVVHLVTQTMNYIQKNYEERLDRNQLAKRVSMSPSYFSVVFKKYTGYTFVQYVTKLRLDQAKELLRSHDLPVAKIAHKVGYRDAFYFSRLFSKEVGMSPREYRKA